MTLFNHLLVFALLNILAIAGTHATLTKEELYWKSVFPNTPIPKFLHDILPRSGVNGKNVLDYTYQYAEESRDHDHALNDKGFNDPNSGSKYPSGRRNNYGNAATINETMYFFQENIVPGKELNLTRLTQRIDRALFLPKQIVESIPLSSDNLREHLKALSFNALKYASKARMVISQCERPGMRGEDRYCATSLESFIDLSVSRLGKNINILSHQLGERLLEDPSFTIDEGIRDMGESNIICHKLEYLYAIYLCHSIQKTTVYEVPMVNKDGTKVTTVAVCHKDTSSWSPKHVSFQFLKIKPGTIPICHVLGRDTVAWVSNGGSTIMSEHKAY